jgi:hypothetical protein
VVVFEFYSKREKEKKRKRDPKFYCVKMKSSSPNFEFKDIKVHVSAMKNATTGGKISFLSLLEKHAPLVKKDCW